MDSPGIALAPFSEDGLIKAVRDAGARVVEPRDAHGLVWTDPSDPEGLKQTLEASPASWVQLPFAGIEAFVAAGAIDRDRTWTCAKGIYGHSCAEHAIALMLAAGRQLHHHVRARKWEPAGLGRPETRLKDKSIVVLGTGGIGTALVPMATAFGATVIGVNRSGRPLEGSIETVTSDRLGDVAGRADFLVLAAAVTPETKGVVDAEVLGSLPGHAWVVNVARGVLIDTSALVEALTGGLIGGAALDVTDPEPLPEDHPLWELDNVIITPHVANTWDMALPELTDLVARNAAAFASGRPLEGLVDVEAGY
ncbi:MAG: D-isomer specific 2-hydroxyacid dehydrogenase family protein [Actinomycetota bacterium]|nr:D-isomer specific 2-hydroxyacid dehydrogenase family protein [Actinomycetota bacterium]